MLRLERDAWSRFKLLRQATHECLPRHSPNLASRMYRTTVLKVPVAESAYLKGAIGGSIGSFLTFLTVTMLGVRAYTVGPDTRYIEAFPTDV